jgi:hypothetical protein
MPEYLIETTQEFSVTYRVTADSPREAWDQLINETTAVCDDQVPGEITGTFDDASIETT